MSDQLKAAIEAVEASNAPKTADEPATTGAVSESETATPANKGEEEISGDQGNPDNGQPPAKREYTELEKAEYNFRKKTNKLTRRLGEREMRIAELEGQLQQQFVPQQVQQKPAQEISGEGEKTLEDFDFDQGAYLRYLAKDEAKREIAERHWRIEASKRQETFREKVTAFIAEHPDYEEVVSAPHVPLTQAVSAVVLETDNPPAIAYYLATNLDEAAAIAGMTPIAMARAIGKIEASLIRAPEVTAPQVPSPPKTVTSAPAVASNVSARSPVAKPVASMTVEDHIEKLRVKSNR